MEIFARLLEATIWPLVIGWIFWSVRSELRALLGRMKSAKYKDFEATFERGLAVTEDVARKAIIMSPTMSSTFLALSLKDPNKYSEVSALAMTSPRAAIMDAWRELELAAVTAALNNRVSLTGKRGRVSGIAAIDHLHESRLISEQVKNLYLHLRELRNQANHAAFEMGVDEAKRYAGLALHFSEWLRDFRSSSENHLK